MENESSTVARDFFGINSKDCLGVVKREEIKERDLCNFMSKEETGKDHDFKGSSKDSAFMGSSGMQWPFSNKFSSLQQFMSFKNAQEERPKKMVLDQLASSGFQPISTADAFDSNSKSSSVPQKSFAFETRQGTQIGLSGYPVQAHDHGISGHRSFPVTNHSIPVAMGNPFFKIHGSANGACGNPTSTMPFGGIPVTTQHSVIPVMGSLTGAFAPRNIAAIPAKPVAATAQMTIFYAGSVNVYDDVPVEKAQAIMFLAGNGASGNPANLRSQTPMAAKASADSVPGNQATSACSALSSPISMSSHSGIQSVAGSNGPEDPISIKTVGALSSTTLEPSKISPGESAADILPRAVPQARKASLARFLEKRKERVANAGPYYGKKSPEDGAADSISFPGTAAAMDCTRACSKSDRVEQTWCLSLHKTEVERAN